MFSGLNVFFLLLLLGPSWEGSRLWLLGSRMESVALLYEGHHSSPGEMAG